MAQDFTTKRPQSELRLHNRPVEQRRTRWTADERGRLGRGGDSRPPLSRAEQASPAPLRAGARRARLGEPAEPVPPLRGLAGRAAAAGLGGGAARLRPPFPPR